MKFIYASLAAFFWSAAGQAAWILPVNNLACTTDINPWGTSSACSCPEGTLYNEKIGQCLTGEKYPIMVSGSIRSANAETKGVFIDTQLGKFKLIVKTSELQRLQRVDGLYFEVEGEFVLFQKKPVIVVDHLRWLE